MTTGRVPGLGEVEFLEFAQAAKANCPVSRSLAGVPEVSLRATPAGE